MRRALAAVALLLAAPIPADAHQLDEYVQASKISIARDLVRVELRLTPGVKVLSRVLAVIDTNGDGVLSADEQHAYAARVRGGGRRRREQEYDGRCDCSLHFDVSFRP